MFSSVKMNKNLQSPTKLTEFAPLQQEEKQQGVTQFISKFFKLNRFTNNVENASVPENNSEKILQESLPAWAIETASDNENSHSESPYSVDIGEGRSLPNVLKRISNLLALKSSNLQAYSDSELKQYWMPDSVSKECYECSEKFTTFRRRHHCRVCGQIFCAQCCNGQIPGKLFGCTGYLRGCTYCCKIVLSYLKSVGIESDLSACLKVLQDSLENKSGIQPDSSPSNIQNSLSPVSSTSDIIESGGTLKRKVSVGYQEEKFTPGSSSVNYITIEERCRALQNSVSLRNLYEEICKPATGIILRSHKFRLRTYNECFLGSELVDWLIRQQKANTRIQASAICQALLEGGYIECVSDPCSFVDGYVLYKPGIVCTFEPLQNLSENSSQDEPTWVQFVSQESNLNDTENEQLSPPFGISSGRLTSSSSYTLDLNIGANTVYLSKPLPSSHSISSSDDVEISENQKIFSMETSVIRTSEQRENVPESGWYNPSQLREDNGESKSYNLLREAFMQHEASLIKQLLNYHGLQHNWSDTLLPLIHEIVDCIHPDLHHNAEFIDVRQYVKFKKIPGGARSDCKLIRGIVCTKNIAHRAMPCKIDNPKILLLLGSIVYQRIEGRLMSLEPVLMQEQESLRNIATRITNLKPDIVLVERNVARLAQDILREQGVTLVLNVKQRILDILSRCTQATLVASVDSHIGKPKLGTCKNFYLKSFKNYYGENKTLMFFENVSQSHLCSTVLLRGSSHSELVKVKKVASLLLFACYNWRLEKSFLMDEFAQPPNAKDEFFDDSREGSPTLAKPHDSIVHECDDLLKNRKISKGSQISNLNIFDENENDMEVFNNTEDVKVNKNDTCSNGVEEKKIVSETVNNYTDPLHSYNKEDDVICRKPTEKLSVADLPFSNHFRKHLDDTILCISPFLVFSVPYLETENGRKCKLRTFFPEQIYYSEQFLHNKRKTNRAVEENNNQMTLTKPKMKPPHPFIMARITGNVDSNEIQKLLAHFRACGGRLQKKVTLDIVNKDVDDNLKKKLKGDYELDHLDVLDPNNHQKLAVLFCSYSHKSNNAPAFCVYPWIVHMGFYGTNDIPLGCFLERYCFRSSYDCQSDTCGTPMLNHIRRFVHNSGCVSISLDVLDTKYTEDKIIMWSWCSKCQTCSPSVPMSGDTWSFSFAKYLELKFHGGLYTRRGNIPCLHNLHHDNIQYFSYNNIVASFEYSHIQLWEISLPPPIIKIKYEKSKDHAEMIEEIKIMALKGHEIFSIISEKLAMLPSDFDGLSNLKQILSKEQSAFKQRVEEVQLKLTSPSLENMPDNFSESSLEAPLAVWRIADALVRVKRLIVEAVEQWNLRLSESFKKKDIDKKKERASHTDLDSPISDSRPVNTHANETDIRNQSLESTSNIINKKIKSLDHSDVNLNCFLSQPYLIPENINTDITHHSRVTCLEDANDKLNKLAQAEDIANVLQQNNNSLDAQIDGISKIKNYTPPSPKCHHRSQSDGTVLSQYEDLHDSKKEVDKKIVKTIFAQLLPSSTGSIPISHPFNTQEHYTLPIGVYFPIVVFESEPSSIISYALNSFDYKRALEDLSYKRSTSNEQTPSPIHKRYSQVDKEKSDMNDTTGEKSSGLLSFLRTKDMKTEFSNGTATTTELSQSVEQTTITDKQEDFKKSKTCNVEIQFEDSNCKFFCRIYFAEKFAALRNVVLPIGEEAYIRSLSRSVQWNARGGKSGSTFCKTTDDRFILKEMPKSEIQLFLEFAPKYFTYVNRCHDTAQPTLLGKIVGIYQVVFKNSTTNATLRTHLLVMENLFYNRIVTQKFDLKGSMRNRLVNPDNQDGEIVLLDENLLKMSCDSPLYVLPHSKAVLTAAIQNDTEFLSAQSVMDYSLLVGLDSENKELVVGIIDYIRTFTWDKKLETMVKKSGILWGQGKLPTIVSPKEYCKRFIEAMHRYFLEVPDPWTGLGKGLEC